MTVRQLLDRLETPDPAARPMMRWWWFGPDVEDAEIDRELRAMAAAGLGGAEIAFVYPLREGAPDYLSDEVLGHVRHAAETARDLGLRLDVTLGSGWSYGGGHIGPEHAARRVRSERRDLGPEALTLEIVPTWPGDAPLAVHLGDGYPPRTWEPLPLEPLAGHGAVSSDGPAALGGTAAAVAPDAVAPGARVRIPVGRGPRTLLITWSETTGQQVKRAAAGAEGPVLDHLNPAAVRHHLDHVGGRILDAVPAELLGSVFCDSLEVYEASWTPALPEEFRARRGYDLLPLLHLLTVDGPDSATLREDFGLTLSELVEEGFVQTCRDWAEEHGVRFRLQGYGEPPITLSAQRRAHLIEGEGAGWTSLTQSRWASSAAHLDAREVVTSEVWTWVHSPSFRATPLDLLGEAHEHLLLGITGFVGHGWPYSAPDAPGLGWTFYAAGALDDRNTWWPAMGELTDHLTRLSGALRLGRPGADVALYLPYADVRSRLGTGHDLWRACRAHIGEEIPAAIRRAGYDLDLVDDDALEALDPTAYPLVVLPHVTRLPAATARWLDRVRAAGGRVLAVDSPAYPAGTPVARLAEAVAGTAALDHSQLSLAARQAGRAGTNPLTTALQAVLDPPVRIVGGGGEIGVVRRRLEDGDAYFLANTGPTPRTLRLTLREARPHLVAVDPSTGVRRALPADGGALRLEPYEAVLLVASADRPAAAAPDHLEPGTTVPLLGPWTLTHGDREPAAVQLPLLLPGAEIADREPLILETTLTLTAEQAAGRIVLDLGEGTPLAPTPGAMGYRALLEAPVREIAIVQLDGREQGILWRPPYRLDLTGQLGAGEHTLRLVLHGTTAPASAVDAHAGPMVAAAHAAYGERFQMQQLDRLLDGTAVGLGAVPLLRLG
ncbi:glycosyl hydrolase [Brachybacterium sp. J153]|uniref:glycosyl hydrolase n=1 Tax=Brachybacterium sp. J153 TaxID=3116488 RepID=UPI002E7871EB|nr:glycosyl hydrolase [Brachybacterium sp. J153]MEE1617676.1 glycosyl hydrolase [Brachybacterium sp. J153]